jgi:predicted metal-dependent phosphotriesterase family hydrolase
VAVSTAPGSPYPIVTVLGQKSYNQLGITDAHNHVWIEPVPGASVESPVLNQYDPILEELVEYLQQGGSSLLDCQPGGCGRDANKLVKLSRTSGVNIIACTGFHRRKYYASGFWLWEVEAQNVSDFLCSELRDGLIETIGLPTACRAGFIKIALEATWAECPQAALEGTASAARDTRALVEIHTERGALAEIAYQYFEDRGVLPHQLVFCHMDKRPDFNLHQAIAKLGVLLEYDTFYRPMYEPDSKLWPLLDQMISAGYSGSIALATDMAKAALYHNLGGGPGLMSLPGAIQKKLTEKGYPENVRMQLLGGNISRRLAGII